MNRTLNRIESDRIGPNAPNRILNRIESDRIGPNGLNRTDWIESETKNWNDSDLNRIVLPTLEGNILRLQIVEIKSEQNPTTNLTRNWNWDNVRNCQCLEAFLTFENC